MKLYTVLTGALLIVSGAGATGIATITLTDAGNNPGSAGYYLSPYNAVVNGTPELVYCDDFNNESQPGELWQAYETAADSSDMSLTRYGHPSAWEPATPAGVGIYQELVWLAGQIAEPANDGSIEAIQDAMWNLTYDAADNPQPVPQVAGYQAWEALAAADYNDGSVDFSQWYVLTNVGGQNFDTGQVQEFLVDTGGGVTTGGQSSGPEPGPAVLLGTGLLAIGWLGRHHKSSR